VQFAIISLGDIPPSGSLQPLGPDPQPHGISLMDLTVLCARALQGAIHVRPGRWADRGQARGGTNGRLCHACHAYCHHPPVHNHASPSSHPSAWPWCVCGSRTRRWGPRRPGQGGARRVGIGQDAVSGWMHEANVRACACACVVYMCACMRVWCMWACMCMCVVYMCAGGGWGWGVEPAATDTVNNGSRNGGQACSRWDAPRCGGKARMAG